MIKFQGFSAGAAVTGGLTYKGTFDASAGTPDISNALQGDLYVISVAGTIYGQTWAVNDHLLINADMGGVIDNAKIDKIDNTSDTALQIANNLSDLNNASTARTNLGLGTAAIEDTGTAVGDVPLLEDVGGGVAGLPAVDGSQLTGITAAGSLLVANNLSDLSNVTTARSNLGLGTAATTASTDYLAVANDLSDLNDAATARTNLGLGTAATTASTDYLAVANDLSDLNNVTTARTNLGLGTAATTASTDYLAVANDLSDLNNVTTARTNLGLGTAAIEDTGTGVGDIPILIDVGGGVAGFSPIDGSNLTGLPSGGLAAVVDDTTPQLGGNLDVNGQSIVSVSNGDIDLAPNGTGVIKTTGSIEPDADLTRTIGTEALRYLTAYTDIDGAIRFKAKNDSGGLMTQGQVVYIKGISGSVPTVDLARSNSASTMPAFGLVHANANDQAEVTIITLGSLYDVDTTTYSLSVGDTVYVSSATAGALTNSPPTGESNLIQNIGKVVRADASAGIIKVGGSGRSAATPNLDTDKVFLGDGSNQAVSTALSAINLSSFNQDLTTTNVSEGTNQYFTTGRVDTQVATLPMSTLSDVAYTAGAGIDNYVLTYDHSSTSWGAEPSAGGGGGWTYNAITSASSPVTSAVSNHYGADTSGGVITFNLPALSGLSGGEEIRIKLNTAGNNLNVTPNGADTIDGSAAAYVLSVALSSITLVASSGTNWEII